MLTIGRVAAQTGLRASAIRYYEAQGLLPRPSRTAGRRIYDPSILDRLAVIELAKAAGFRLDEIRAMLSGFGASQPSPAWRTLTSAKGVEIDQQMKRLLLMKHILARLKACRCATLDECGRAFIAGRADLSASDIPCSRVFGKRTI